MAIFAVILHDPDPSVITRLENAYPDPDHLRIQPNVYLITGDFLIEQIVRDLHFTQEATDAGIVFRLNGTYGGRTYPSVWDWLARAAKIPV